MFHRGENEPSISGVCFLFFLLDFLVVVVFLFFLIDHSKHSVTKALQIKQCLEFTLSYILVVSAV